MKFPVSVVAKKYPQKNSLKDENDVNRLNSVCSPDIKDVPIPTDSTPFLQSAISPEILCKTDVHRQLSETDFENTSDVALQRRLSSDDGVDDGNVSDSDSNSHLERTRYSRQNSIYDDSGFNSSSSEDKDDIAGSLLNLNFEREDENDGRDLCENNQVSSQHRLSLDSNFKPKNSKISLTKSVASSTDKLNADEVVDLTVVDRKLEEVDLIRVSCSSGMVSVQNSARRIERTEITSTTSVGVNSSVRTRVVRRRRRTKDINNNVLVSENFSSSLWSPPFKLVDFFQNRGFLALMACIIYTLALVFLIGVIGVVAQSVKSVVGRKDLMEIKENIVRARSKRMAAASG